MQQLYFVRVGQSICRAKRYYCAAHAQKLTCSITAKHQARQKEDMSPHNKPFAPFFVSLLSLCNEAIHEVFLGRWALEGP